MAVGDLSDSLERSLTATASLAATELYNEGKSAANDPSEYPFAQIAERMDSRTCPLCEFVDGKILEVGSPEYAEWKSPSHVNCRRVMVYIHKEEAGVEADFVKPPQELIEQHGHYHVQKRSLLKYKIPAQPAGRQFIVRVVIDPATGKKVAHLDWAPWTAHLTDDQKRLILKARAVHSRREVLDILAQLGITDLGDPAQQRQIALLGLRDRVEGLIAEAGGAATRPLESLKQEVTGVGGPRGVKVSQALAIDRNPAFYGSKAQKRAEAMHETAQAIDALHGDGILPTIPVEQIPDNSAFGFFQFQTDGTPVKINVSPSGDHPRMTFAHEVGHFLDNNALGPGVGRWGSIHSADMDEWIAATERSEWVKEHRRRLNGPDEAVAGGGTRFMMPKKTIEYQLDPKELWARSYAQWVATRTGGEMAKELQGEIDLSAFGGTLRTNTQWDHDDFVPIAEAIEKLFRAKGWIE